MIARKQAKCLLPVASASTIVEGHTGGPVFTVVPPFEIVVTDSFVSVTQADAGSGGCRV